MAKAALAEKRQDDGGILRSLFPADERSRPCPRCGEEAPQTRDRVVERIVEHPRVIVRGTQFWRCPRCNAISGQESRDYVEPIEYITGQS